MLADLSKYQGIVDIDAEIKKKQDAIDAEIREKREKIEAEARSMHESADQEIASAKQEAKELRAKGKASYESAVKETELKLSFAEQEAKRIVSEAENRAKEIAGEAYEIAGKAKDFEKTATAMKNIIEGYGDRYLKPTYSLLDDLAADFGYTEAGQQLKLARQNSERMINAGTAATCEYVDSSRQRTAIAFVIDAFNGKVDSIRVESQKGQLWNFRAKNQGCL